MRVLLLGPVSPPYGGPEKITETLLASSLFRDSFEIHHVNIQKPLRNEQRSRFNLVNVFYNARHLLAMIVSIARYRPRVVFLFLAQNKIAFLRDAIFIATAVLLGRRVVASREGSYFRTFYEQSSPAWKRLIRGTLKLPHRIRIESELVRSQLAGLVEPDRLVVCRAGIDVQPFLIRPGKSELAAPVRILFVGNISVAKGTVDLVRAFTVVKNNCTERVELRLMGDFLNKEQNIIGTTNRDNAETQIRTLIREHGLEDAVVFTGPKYGPEKIDEFVKADIFALISHSEGLSNAMLEALAAGLPVVLSNAGALPEGAVGGVNGFVVEAGDWTKAGECLSMLVSSPKLRADMGRASRELCQEKFTVNGFVACLSKILSAP